MPLRGQQPRMLAVSIVLITIATLSAVLRLLSRRVVHVGLWWDDWCSLVALALSYALNIVQFVSIHCGLGQHTLDVPDPKGAMGCFLKGLYIIEPFYIVCMTSIKTTMVLLYWRLFNTSTSMRWALFLAVGMLVVWTICALFIGLFQCTPVARYWDKELPGHCLNGLLYFRAIAGTNLVTDIYILVLPLPIVWRLHRPMREKLALMLIFALGTFVSLVSIVRIVLLTSPDDPDPLYDSTPGTIWTAVETSIGVVSVNLPATAPLLRRYILRRPIPAPTTSATAKTAGFHTYAATNNNSSSSSKPSYPPPNRQRSAGNDPAATVPGRQDSLASLRPFGGDGSGVSTSSQQHILAPGEVEHGGIELGDWMSSSGQSYPAESGRRCD
ncbi:hypothetical protein NUU61_008083 [Penicillium alfredii]|uniref:Rhodopsin domain-containing protein n=1 Tax=Penicillium alfredii TaxID=1506179 RepID=A0A9W9JZ65_9EURO|nr:uncharacterized protein NUU61_008083 [Penicillium alfredii]KAJ5086776.1 hypothetical protein NUU61_008083 [Penicillium alfredii]